MGPRPPDRNADPSPSASPPERPARMIAHSARMIARSATPSGLLVVTAILAVATDPAAAHAGALSGTVRAAPVPSWLVIVTGGGVIGASFLFTSLVTDHALIRAVNDLRVGAARRSLPTRETIGAVAVWTLRALSVLALAAIVAVGLWGPSVPIANLAVVGVWAGWWAGYTITTYVLGDTWPLLNPWRALVAVLSRIGSIARDLLRDLDLSVPESLSRIASILGVRRSYPDRLGAWPSVVGLLGLVWLEVVSPVAQRPRLLVGVILAYSALTVAGGLVYGSGTWFGLVDPIARVFRWYGRAAPIQRTESGVEFRLPGAALATSEAAEDAAETAFVIALLWVTTYDGLVATPAWNDAVRALDSLGVPPLPVYVVTIVAGFAGFLAIYRFAARWSRRSAESYVSARFVRDWFAPALLPIAAGYHLAHFLGYFLSLSPNLVAVIADPLAPPIALQNLVLPGWFGTLQLVFVLLGHLLAVWIAHARSFRVFSGRLQPIRSQYPFILVMIFYTMTSMWIVAQPFTEPYL